MFGDKEIGNGSDPVKEHYSIGKAEGEQNCSFSSSTHGYHDPVERDCSKGDVKGRNDLISNARTAEHVAYLGSTSFKKL